MNILMPDDGCSAASVGKLVREERAEEAGILACGAQFNVASGVVGMEMRDEEARQLLHLYSGLGGAANYAGSTIDDIDLFA